MSGRIICIDPGPVESGLVIMLSDGTVTDHVIDGNAEILDWLGRLTHGTLIVEMIASYGMAVGKDVFETCVWIGRFVQVWHGPVERITRKDVKLALCGTTKAKDANIRQALIDIYGPGKETAIGRKANPGPLYGIRKHEWAALAVGVAYRERLREEAA